MKAEIRVIETLKLSKKEQILWERFGDFLDELTKCDFTNPTLATDAADMYELYEEIDSILREP